MNYVEHSRQKKRKYPSYSNKPVQTAAKEFLEKASRELLGDAHDGPKGPVIQIDDSDDNDDPMN